MLDLGSILSLSALVPYEFISIMYAAKPIRVETHEFCVKVDHLHFTRFGDDRLALKG